MVDVLMMQTFLKVEREHMRATPMVTLRAMLTTPALRRPLLIAVMMMLAQQLSGINAVVFFSTTIFEVGAINRYSVQFGLSKPNRNES